MKDTKASVQSQFGQTAENYRHSKVHATGQDLIWLTEELSREKVNKVLDAGCGAGHVSVTVAPYVEQVVALDLTENMLEQVNILAEERGVQNLETRQGDVEELPFEDATFDLVISRYSAHHWTNPVGALAEINRVLKDSGRFILIDIVGYESYVEDTFLQTIELLRDLSHVRDYTVSQWKNFFAEIGFTSPDTDQWGLDLDIEAWLTRMAVPEQRVIAIRDLLDNCSDNIREVLKYDTQTLTLQTVSFDARKTVN